jgi:hypothetical protein
VGLEATKPLEVEGKLCLLVSRPEQSGEQFAGPHLGSGTEEPPSISSLGLVFLHLALASIVSCVGAKG